MGFFGGKATVSRSIVLRIIIGIGVGSAILSSSVRAEQVQPDCEVLLIPSVYDQNIVRTMRPQPVHYRSALSSPAVTDPWIRLGRAAVAYPDFKFLADLEPKDLTDIERRQVISQAKKMRRRIFTSLIDKGMNRSNAVRLAQKGYARWIINHLFQVESGLKPVPAAAMASHLRLIAPAQGADFDVARLQDALDHVEAIWSQLVRQSPSQSKGSLLPSPFPVMIAGGRFRESYYWDTYFGALGLEATGRWDLAAAQLENLLHMIQIFGRIPNGFRDYYLTRSQPPVISMMAMMIYDSALKNNEVSRVELNAWLTQRVYPLLRRDYEKFWMVRRYDPETGLNFYSDDLNQMRPERHSNDNEHALGRTLRDVRAEAESGLDHTDAFMGEASQTASVSLNSFLYRYELDLKKMAEIAGDRSGAARYARAAGRRKAAMTRYLWDDHYGIFRNYNLRMHEQADIVSADMVSALYVNVADLEQARLIKERLKVWFEKTGGLTSSMSQSGKQWDGNHGWAPIQIMAIEGLSNYGFDKAARRLAGKWTSALADIYAQTGAFHEKIDAFNVSVPDKDDSKYPTQTGFLWTNASYVWALKFLGFGFLPN